MPSDRLKLIGKKLPCNESAPWYDTKEDIAGSIGSLEDFNELIGQRRTAGYERQEMLKEFVIFGCYYLDKSGNCWKAEDRFSRDNLPGITDVLTRDEFWKYIRRHVINVVSIGYSYDDGKIPIPDLRCSFCGKTWTVENCHDTVVRDEKLIVTLSDFIGMTLGEVKKAYFDRRDAIYQTHDGSLIRNDRFIDPTPICPDSEYEWERRVVKNRNGWVGKDQGISDDYVIQPGDQGMFSVDRYYHRECNRINSLKEKEGQFSDIFKKAGFTVISMQSIPNEYCSCELCAPWFLVNTEFGVFKIGWRKRVINIDWCAVNVPPNVDIISLFVDEDVTKGNNNIHAWGWEKVEEYLTKIYNMLSNNK